jgi:hypothetical protein
MDEVKLELARQAAEERKVGNVEFLARNVKDWNEPNSYDLVYAVSPPALARAGDSSPPNVVRSSNGWRHDRRGR